MKPIVTLTLNPAIDGAAEADTVRPIHKIRTWGERYDPGGGGINVARVIHALGGSAFAIYLSGGTTGPVLDTLVRAAGLDGIRVPIEGHTRISHTVHEHSTGLEFRFVPQGPVVATAEWRACLDVLQGIECEYLVASGSLPRGVPDDFYVQVAAIAARRGAKVVLDTSGEALKQAMERGVYLVKPSLGELERLAGRELKRPADQEAVVRTLVESGSAQIVALTLGREGALLGTRNGLHRLAGLQVKAESAVGAGDSFLAAMTLGLAEGCSAEEAFARAVAAGTAAVLARGTELCRREDVERLYQEIKRSGGPKAIP